MGNHLRLFVAAACLFIASFATASEYHGQVTFNGLPVPGVTVIATQGGKQAVTVSDPQGFYSFPDLTDGTCTMTVAMTGFATITREVVIAPENPAANWELQLLPLERIRADLKPVVSSSISPPAPAKRESEAVPDNPSPGNEATQQDLSQRAADGLLINGSVNNGAASPFAQLAAFGNNRNGAKGLWNGGIGIIFDNSALDARPFSLSGLNTPKSSYNRITGIATLGGPLKIPHVLEHGPSFFVGYQWTRSRDAAAQAGLVPDSYERGGDFSHEVNALGQPIQIYDPATGLLFPGNAIPSGQISPQAQALLNLYPAANVAANPQYNYQIPIVSSEHQDALQSRLDKTFNSKNEVYGDFSFQSTRSGGPNLFGFLDTTDVLGINTGVSWSHRFNERLFLNLGYRFSRLRTRVSPYWENRANVSEVAGITGNNQEPINWGPPSLGFSSGVAGLSDGQSAFDRNETNAWSYSMLWNRSRHNIEFGGDFRRQEFNYLSQQDPRGTFTFTGAATQGIVSGVAVDGSDVADFMLGIPDTSAIAFGNADKYFRESVYDAYVRDDWRISPELTVNAGVRWEYGAPITELHGRLVNLDIAPGFSSSAPVVARDPVGPLTGQRYPKSLIHPDKRGFEPRVGLAWRPIPGSSMVVRAGYGVYYDTSVYPTIALQMAQQAPLSKSLSVQNSAACPLTLANGFNTCPSITPDNFAVDPNFRAGYAQTWQLSVQRDLPHAMLLTGTYLGIKGTRGAQEFLPNTFPVGAVNPCPACPAGFVFLASSGNSTREAGQVQVRRRLHNGFTGTLQYTFSKSVDDVSSLGGQGASVATQNTAPTSGSGTVVVLGGQGTTQNAPTIAQNWLDLRAERGLSTFHQQHLLSLQLQYTTGLGLGGKTLMSGWQGLLFKEWTFAMEITAGSGLPETPVYLAAVPGTGITGTIRPDVTGASLYAAPPRLFLNPAAYTAPQSGQWGNAGRDSIIGPSQFTLNASIGRTFRLRDRFHLDFRIDAQNALNHVTFTGWNATVNSTQFGLPTAANEMRNMQATLRLRF